MGGDNYQGDIIIVIWICYLCFMLPNYLRIHKKYGAEKSIKYKLSLSLTFCLLGLFAAIQHRMMHVSVLVVHGLIVASLGDYFLLLKKVNKSNFIKGILCFSLTHILYLAGLFLLLGISWYEFLVTSVLFGVVLFLKKKKRISISKMGKNKKYVMGYVLLVSLMVAKSSALLLYCFENVLFSYMFFIGAVLFWISDLFIGIREFAFFKQKYQYIVSVFYFVGQLMIATSIFFLK